MPGFDAVYVFFITTVLVEIKRYGFAVFVKFRPLVLDLVYFLTCQLAKLAALLQEFKQVQAALSDYDDAPPRVCQLGQLQGVR